MPKLSRLRRRMTLEQWQAFLAYRKASQAMSIARKQSDKAKEQLSQAFHNRSVLLSPDGKTVISKVTTTIAEHIVSEHTKTTYATEQVK